MKKSIIWNGENTQEVVNFCTEWQYDLCGIHYISTNLINGKKMLSIEPSDTMRGRCLSIDLGQKCVRAGGFGGVQRYIYIMD